MHKDFNRTVQVLYYSFNVLCTVIEHISRINGGGDDRGGIAHSALRKNIFPPGCSRRYCIRFRIGIKRVFCFLGSNRLCDKHNDICPVILWQHSKYAKMEICDLALKLISRMLLPSVAHVFEVSNQAERRSRIIDMENVNCMVAISRNNWFSRGQAGVSQSGCSIYKKKRFCPLYRRILCRGSCRLLTFGLIAWRAPCSTPCSSLHRSEYGDTIDIYIDIYIYGRHQACRL